MTDVVNQSLETAKTILGMQGLALKFQVEEEASDEVDEGYVIRTKPAVGEKIKTGDTVVLYVSTGPKKVKMINVVGEDLDTALKLLKVAGFTNIKYDDYVEDEAPVDQVVTQSVAENTEIPVNTQIVLQISKGPAEITKMVNFGLMEDMIEAYEVVITRKDTGEEIFNATISASKTEISLELSGKGKVIYVVTMGGNTSYEQEVDFSTP
jgi:serine/threonine-protein kinase